MIILTVAFSMLYFTHLLHAPCWIFQLSHYECSFIFNIKEEKPFLYLNKFKIQLLNTLILIGWQFMKVKLFERSLIVQGIIHLAFIILQAQLNLFYSMNELKFRKSELEDVDQIALLLNQAKQYFKDKGIPQWQTGPLGYPNAEVVQQDIKQESSYIVQSKGDIIGTVCLAIGRDELYESFPDIKWLTTGQDYLTIHRAVVKSGQRNQGVGKFMLQEAEKICRANEIKSMRIDSHVQNKQMHEALKRKKFVECGKVVGSSKQQRFAFEKLIDEQ